MISNAKRLFSDRSKLADAPERRLDADKLKSSRQLKLEDLGPGEANAIICMQQAMSQNEIATFNPMCINNRGGLGCVKSNKPWLGSTFNGCQFCGFGVYASIPCGAEMVTNTGPAISVTHQPVYCDSMADAPQRCKDGTSCSSEYLDCTTKGPRRCICPGFDQQYPNNVDFAANGSGSMSSEWNEVAQRLGKYFPSFPHETVYSAVVAAKGDGQRAASLISQSTGLEPQEYVEVVRE